MKNELIRKILKELDPTGEKLKKAIAKYSHRHYSDETVQRLGMDAFLERAASLLFGLSFSNVYHFECFDSFGKLKWVDDVHNRVVNATLNHILDVAWNNGTSKTAWYVGLTDGTPTVAAADTMASHAGWGEVTNYTEGVRQTLVLPVGEPTGESVDNSASKAVFSINATVTIGGGFITDNSTKGGATGLLGGGDAFTGGDKGADNGDTLNVTATLTASSS